jgi:hypothetical protein
LRFLATFVVLPGRFLYVPAALDDCKTDVYVALGTPPSQFSVRRHHPFCTSLTVTFTIHVSYLFTFIVDSIH